MISEQSLKIVKATAPVVGAHAEQITRRFYQLLFAAYPQVLAYFNPAHQQSGTQQQALAGAICAYAANIDNLGALGNAVELIAQKHCSLGIQPEHYPLVGEQLLIAVKDVLGDAVTPEVTAAWAEAYGQLADIFIQREQEIYRGQLERPGGWNGYRRFRVTRKKAESEIVSSFYLQPEDGGELPHYHPGQYVTVRIQHPTVPTSPRNYSLSDRPGLDYFRISVKREPNPQPETPAGLVSNYLHDQIHEGDVIELGPPCGEFVLPAERTAERPLVFLAGGIGITPLLSMLKHLGHVNASTPIHFLQAARNSVVHALGHEVRGIVESLSNVNYHVRYNDPLHDDLEEGRCHSVGMIDQEFLKGFVPTLDADFYFCGPKPFMVGVHRQLREWGVDPAQLHFEFFGPRQEIAGVA